MRARWGRRSRLVTAAATWIFATVLLVTFAILLFGDVHERAVWPTVLSFVAVASTWAFGSFVIGVRDRLAANEGSEIRSPARATWQLVRLAVLLLFCQASLLAADAAVLSYRYDIPFSKAAKGVVREVGLNGIGMAVAIFDPCAPRIASTGPDVGRGPGSPELVRIEHLVDGRFSIDEVHNKTIVRSHREFHYQPYEEARLQELRRKYELDRVVAPATDEFEAMVLLRCWVRSQFRRQDYQPLTDNFDALEVLDRNLRNHTGEPYEPYGHFNPCHFFPLLYCQVQISMGHQARLVSIGHGMAEVWSNQFQKWVLMDVELNWHYEKDGVPLNMVEVFEENFANGPTRVRIVRGQQTSDPNTTRVFLGVEDVAVETMILAHRKRLTIVDMRNDWLTNHYFRGHPTRSEQNSLVYADSRLNVPTSFAERLRPQTSNKQDFYWTLNQTEIRARQPQATGDAVELVFSTVTPNFQSFETVVDGGPPTTSASPDFRWQLHEGVNTLAVRSVNLAGVKGIVSSAKLVVPNPGQ